MVKDTIETVLNKYVTSAEIYGSAFQEGKHKIANKQFAVLKRIYEEYGNNLAFRNGLKDLLNAENPDTVIAAAAHLLGLNSDIIEAQAALEALSKRDDIGASRLSAEMTLKVWREQGYLKF